MALAITERGAAAHQASTEAMPPLEAGDRLTRAEFERRYQAMIDLKKAELIEGKVYMPSSVSLKHGRPDSKLTTWLGVYESATPGVVSSSNTTVRFDEDNEPQPDVLLVIDPACGGQSRVDEDEYVASPEHASFVATLQQRRQRV